LKKVQGKKKEAKEQSMAQDALDALEESLKLATTGISAATITKVNPIAHTINSPAAVPNLLDMGIDDDIMF
jgi:hypothetical protein